MHKNRNPLGKQQRKKINKKFNLSGIIILRDSDN